MWALVKEGMEEWFYKNAQVVNLLPLIEKEVVNGKITATSGRPDPLFSRELQPYHNMKEPDESGGLST